MNREQKAAAIAEIAQNIQESEAIFAVDYRGISVPQAAELRAQLREADTRFTVVKNTLTERAADQAGAEVLKSLLEGPTALAFVRGAGWGARRRGARGRGPGRGGHRARRRRPGRGPRRDARGRPARPGRGRGHARRDRTFDSDRRGVTTTCPAPRSGSTSSRASRCASWPRAT